MAVLKEYKWLQKWMGLNPQGGFENIVLRLFYFFIGVSGEILFAIFVVINFRKDKYRALSALPVVLGYALFTTNYFHLWICREGFFSLSDELQNIVNERMKKEENEKIYEKAAKEGSFVTKFIIYVMFSTIFSLSPLVVVAYHWCLGKYTLNSWIFFFPVWTPSELNSTQYCALMVFFEAFSAMCVESVFCLIQSFLVTLMLYSETCTVDISSLFLKADRLSQCVSSRQSNLANFYFSRREDLDLKILEIFKEAVVLHRKMNGLMYGLADIMNAIILETIALAALVICISLLLIDKYRGLNFVHDLQMPVLVIICALSTLGIFFSFGEKLHINSMELSRAIYQTEWHKYPRSVQRFVLLMMQRSQQPFYLSAYGMMELKLENFARLLKWIYSAYMVLRSLN